MISARALFPRVRWQDGCGGTILFAPWAVFLGAAPGPGFVIIIPGRECFWNFFDGVLRNDLEFELVRERAVELDLRGVLAEAFYGAMREVDALAVNVQALSGESGGNVGGGDRAEHFPALARFHGEDERNGGEGRGEALGAFEFAGFAGDAGLLQGFDVLAVGAAYGKRDALGEQIVAGMSGADFDLVAFGAEVFDGFEEEDFGECHGGVMLVLY